MKTFTKKHAGRSHSEVQVQAARTHPPVPITFLRTDVKDTNKHWKQPGAPTTVGTCGSTGPLSLGRSADTDSQVETSLPRLNAQD